MPTIKTNPYASQELDYLEKRLNELKEYIDSNPLSELSDRYGERPTKDGGTIEYVIATKEAQRKDLTAALKDYADMVQVVEKMRETEAKKVETRGDKKVTLLAKNLIDG